MCRAESKSATASGRRMAPTPCCRRAPESVWPTPCFWTSNSVSNHASAVGQVRLAGGTGRAGGRPWLGHRERPRVTSAVRNFRAAGLTDVGAQRVVNEDRFHVDEDRGIFIVVDGVGGQAAGGRAADTALEIIRTRLANGSGASATRVREAIAAANNEIHRQALTRPEWRGMACVLTVAVIEDA